jgi:hypothetical protein
MTNFETNQKPVEKGENLVADTAGGEMPDAHKKAAQTETDVKAGFKADLQETKDKVKNIKDGVKDGLKKEVGKDDKIAKVEDKDEKDDIKTQSA